MKKCNEIAAIFRPYAEKILTWSKNTHDIPRWGLIIGLAFVLILAAGLRGMRIYAEPVLSVDGANYVMNAEAMQQAPGSGEIGFSPHGFYAAYLASGLFHLSPHQLGVATNLVLGSLLPLLFFAIAQSLFHQGELSLCCALISAVHPKLIAYSIEVQREIPYLFFCGVCFFFAVLFVRHRKWFFNALTALGATLSLTFRYEGFELFLFAFLLFAILFVREKSKRWKVAGEFGLFAVSSILSGWLILTLLNLAPLTVLTSLIHRLHF